MEDQQMQDQPPVSTDTQKANNSKQRVSLNDKIDTICALIESLNLTPKSFFTGFLDSSKENIAYRRRFWGTERGWNSTESILLSLRRILHQNRDGRDHWEAFILSQAISIVRSQNPISGYYPHGSYVNAAKLTEGFFTEEERLGRIDSLIERMPFLYKLLYSKLNGDSDENEEEDTHSAESEDSDMLESDDETMDHQIQKSGKHSGQQTENSNGSNDFELSASTVDAYHDCRVVRFCDARARKRARNESVARTVCSMIAFATNRRHNGFQLANSLVFIASGVPDRVNAYLNYIGLASSRRTAYKALQTLGKKAETKLKDQCSAGKKKGILLPNVCFDNLHLPQKDQLKSTGADASPLFHWTWGYIHSIPPSISVKLDPKQLTISAMTHALDLASQKGVINLEPFTPSMASTNHFVQTLKSQITSVILKYLASPIDQTVLLSTKPPDVEPLKPEKTDISMLKLMMSSGDYSSDSVEGMGEALTGIIKQTGLNPAQFRARPQIVEGELGTCKIIEKLRKQKTPPTQVQAKNLDNLLPIPGAAHIQWNISQAIFFAHWGNDKNSHDTGAWRVLQAMGIPAAKPTTHKDFHLMLQHIEKIHEVTLLYCVLVVLDRHKEPLGSDLLQLSSERIQSLVDETYERFCSEKARHSEAAANSPALSNMLLRIRDFGTAVEANQSMKAGDPGRLMYIWNQWAIMSQALPNLTDYSKYLPKLIYLLKEALPLSLSQSIISTVLISPTGKPDHFVATDFFLEVQKYWLKYLYTYCGIGTDINMLKDIFSTNIPALRFLLQSLKLESGMRIVEQSHNKKTQLPLTSINGFIQMANEEKILEPITDISTSPTTSEKDQVIQDSYRLGMVKLEKEFKLSRRGLKRFRPTTSTSKSNTTTTTTPKSKLSQPRRPDIFPEAYDDLLSPPSSSDASI